MSTPTHVEVLKIFYESQITSIKYHTISHSIHKSGKKNERESEGKKIHSRVLTSRVLLRAREGNDWRKNDFFFSYFVEGCEIASLLHPALISRKENKICWLSRFRIQTMSDEIICIIKKSNFLWIFYYCSSHCVLTIQFTNNKSHRQSL